jgi:hypothetical protein
MPSSSSLLAIDGSLVADLESEGKIAYVQTDEETDTAPRDETGP